MCCYGAAIFGPGRCTCWEPVYDIDQEEPHEGPLGLRDRMCHDCAFRQDSPERSGDGRYAHSGEVDGLARGGGLFVCHQGMRRKVAIVHPSGARVEIGIDAYAPGGADIHPCKSDGSPADVCAGYWAARRRIDVAEEAAGKP